jgi:hypothetical protein
MPFEDFSKKTWKIIAPGSEQCETNDTVRISMSDQGVTVECGTKAPYAKAKYNEHTNRIETDDYEIRLQITFIPKILGPIGGSWTAEDTSGGNNGG